MPLGEVAGNGLVQLGHLRRGAGHATDERGPGVVLASDPGRRDLLDGPLAQEIGIGGHGDGHTANPVPDASGVGVGDKRLLHSGQLLRCPSPSETARRPSSSRSCSVASSRAVASMMM